MRLTYCARAVVAFFEQFIRRYVSGSKVLDHLRYVLSIDMAGAPEDPTLQNLQQSKIWYDSNNDMIARERQQRWMRMETTATSR